MTEAIVSLSVRLSHQPTTMVPGSASPEVRQRQDGLLFHLAVQADNRISV